MIRRVYYFQLPLPKTIYIFRSFNTRCRIHQISLMLRQLRNVLISTEVGISILTLGNVA